MKEHPVRVFERSVFDSACLFNAVRFKGRGQFDRVDFGLDFPKAVAFVRAQIGRPWALYASNAAGRQVCLERDLFDEYLARWEANAALRDF